MRSQLALIGLEARLLLREPVTLVFTVLLPVALLLVFGLGFRDDPAPAGAGQHDQPAYLPALSLMIAVGMLGFFGIPSVLGTYRERGILRRLSVTPVHPAKLLVAQLVVQLGTALVTVVVVLSAAHVVVGMPLPTDVVGFALALFLGLSCLFAVGLVVAALSPTGRIAGSVGPLLFFPMLFLAGTWLPRDRMPDWLATIGAFSPLGAFVDTVGAAWQGDAPRVAQLVGMAALAAVLGIVATRTFRWE